MTKDEIFAGLRDLMVELFELQPSQIRLESRLIDDLDLDSIDAIDMAVKLQEITGKRLEEEKLRSIRTVSDIVNLVFELLNKKGVAPSGPSG
jgi:acyl carrier protein